MKIRKVRAQNLRNFGPDAPPVSFVDPDTNRVRPLTILVGANGSGKTTLLELIELMCWVLVFPRRDDSSRFGQLLSSLKTTSSVILTFGTPGDIIPVEGFVAQTSTSDNYKIHLFGSGITYSQKRSTELPDSPNAGGLLYFPYYRRFKRQDSPRISQPPTDESAVYRYHASGLWEGSLDELWVWQNYLDLESQQAGHSNLLPFIDTIQTVLGKDQKIKIHRGEVWIERPYRGDRVRLHELPAGEQQVLVLFGELIRRLKPGAIVMIDEVEISLHPGLQRVVLHHLRRLALQHDIQVILTTHSLEIVADADPLEIVNLDNMIFTERTARTAEAAE